MKNAVIYIRVSTKEQVQNMSLATQERACLEYCKTHSFNVDKIFVEEGESAKTTHRTEFNNMLEHCKKNKGKIEALVVYAINRFARNAKDHAVIRAYLSTFKITLRSVTEGFDDSSAGKFMETVLSGVAQLDNDVRAERTRTGMTEAMESGRFLHHPPTGYVMVGDQKKSNIVPDGKISGFITKGFEHFAQGVYTQRQTLDHLIGLGFRMPDGKEPLQQTFRKILENHAYSGWIVSKKNGTRVKGGFTPLVNQVIFDRVQALLFGNRPNIVPHLRNNADFPLRNFVRCGGCERALTGSWSKGRNKRYPNYFCQNKECRAVSVRKEVLEELFTKYINSFRPRLEYMALFHATLSKAWKERQGKAVDQTTSLQGQLKALQMQKQKLVQAYVYEKAISKSVYDVELERLDHEIGLAEMRLNDSRQEGFDVEGALNFLDTVCQDPGRLWQAYSLNQRQRLQKVLFPAGVQFLDGEFGTAERPLFVELLQASEVKKTKLVALLLKNWNPIIEWLKKLTLLQSAEEPIPS